MKNLALLFLITLGLYGCGCSIVDPGERGVKVYLGEIIPPVQPEGLVTHLPMLTSVRTVLIKQQTAGMHAECYSADLQQVKAALKVMYRIPESQVIQMVQMYAGDPFAALVEPRVQEAFKEVTSLRSAEQIVKEREHVKLEALDSARKKIGDAIVLVDIVIENLDLSKLLEAAIEDKMVQEQTKQKASYLKQQAEIEAETAVVRATGEANAIKLRGEALRTNPEILDLMTIEKWNGITPQAVGVGTNMMLPLEKKK